jgi:cobalt-zinc-cadmium efflux system outer membrane protein
METLRLKTPIVARLFAALLIVLTVAMPERASAQGPAEGPSWTVDEAVERALENPEIEAVLAASIEAARAEVDEATVRRTPSLNIDHEHVLGSARVGYIQTTAMIRQTFDFTPWRRRLKESVPHREAALQAETDQWSLEVATAVRLAFYQVRYHEERIAAIDAWIVRLEQGVAAIDKRRAGGDASPYEVRRVERELEIARARRAQEQARLAEAWADLSAWTPWDVQPSLTGALTPSDVPAGDLATLPKIVQLEQRELALDAELDVWGRPFGRDWSFGAAARYARQGGDNGYGFMLTLSVPLTFWNTDRPRIDRIRAEHEQVEGQLRYARTLAEQAEQATRKRLKAALDALGSLPTAEHDAELSHLAEAAFGAGEGTLIELLDAYESEAELHLARIDLQWEARRAAIDLQRRLGIGVAR